MREDPQMDADGRRIVEIRRSIARIVQIMEDSRWRCLPEWLRRLRPLLLKIPCPPQRLDAGFGERDGEVNGAVAL